MTYTPPGNEPQQPYSAPQQNPYSTPQQQYSTPQYDVGQGGGYAAYAAPAPKSDKRTLGLWSMILGISSILIPLFLNSIAGGVLGGISLAKENAKGMAITGLITSVLGLIWGFIFWFAVFPLILFTIIYGAAVSTTGY